MTLMASNTGGGGGNAQAELLEAGNYPARVVQVIDLGLQPQRPYEGKVKPPANEIMVTYELVTEFMKEDGADVLDKPRWISERFPLFSLRSERAKSTKRYNSIDPSHQHGGDWSALVDIPCLVAIVNNTSKSNGKTYNNVGGVSLPIKGMPVAGLVNPPKVFTLDDPDMVVFETIPDWIKDLITDNLEFNGSKLQAALEGNPIKAQEPEDKHEDLDDADVPF